MNILETDQWCLLLPPEWIAERDDDIVHITDQDGVGELEITTLCSDTGAITIGDVKSMALEESPEVGQWEPVRLGAFEGVSGEFFEDGAAITEWYVAKEAVLLYITYLCDEEDAGMDLAAIVDILSTLVLGDSALA